MTTEAIGAERVPAPGVEPALATMAPKGTASHRRHEPRRALPAFARLPVPSRAGLPVRAGICRPSSGDAQGTATKTLDRLLQRWRITKARPFVPFNAKVLDVGW